MASLSSSSSSSSRVYEKYDVFLSFRGEDTRENFISHLYAALCSKKIKTFIDSYDLERGYEISQALLNAIEESKIAVIIFSKGYATSRWCLEELAKIIEGKKAEDLILPVFYHADPSDIRNQKGSFEKAFVRHKEKQSSETVMRWRNALTKAANLSGFDSSDIRPDSTLVEEIVSYILNKLNQMSPSDNKNLIGVESKIEEVESLLCFGLKDVSRSVGIWGMGGIGKTTLARAIFNRISSQFEKAHFQDNVRKECEKSELTDLSQKVLFAILDDKDANLDFIFTKRRLCSMKILICFDDVTCFEQIEKFTGDCFGSGSRIIITSRDKQVLKTCGVEQDYIYKVEELSYDEALELFCRHAFKQNQPTAGYMELSELALTFAKGIPLALKTLGGLLFEKTKSEWEDELNKLERISNPKIEDVLKISYDGLDDEHKNIFLDIACFFNGDDKNFVMKILDDNGFAAKSGVSALIDKSLITLSGCKIIMHDLLQEMGRKIVSKESKNLGKRSRLWHREDINRALKTNMGTGAIECIRLEMSKAKPFKLHPHAFSNMHNLRFLDFYCDIDCSCNFYNSHCKGGYICKEGQIDNKVHPSEDLEFVLFELRYCCWYGYPLPSLPSTFDVENLVSLVMPCSKIKILNFVQQYDKLKHINLSNSKLLTRIQDLSMIPNVESLILEGCTSLIKVFSSKKYLKKLAIINLRGCKSLKRFLSTSCVNSVESLDLSGCQIPKLLDNLSQLSFLRELFLAGQNFELIPGIEKLSNLVVLDVRYCQGLRSLPELSNLDTLYASNCQRLQSLPELSNLVTLDASNCQRLRSLPELSNLVTLRVCNCQRLRSLPELPSLYNLYADNCTSLEALRVPFSRRTTISLANCHKLDRNVLKAKVENALELYAERRKYSAPILYGWFPGNEIPNGYSYQNMGSSIIIKLPPDLTNYKSILFDVCFVVNPHHSVDYDPHHPVDYDPPLLDSESSDEYWHFHFHTHVEKHYIPLDHVCVRHASVDKGGWWNKLGNTSLSLHFYCFYEHQKFYEMTKCGVNIFYEKAEKEESTYVFSTKEKEEGKEEQQV